MWPGMLWPDRGPVPIGGFNSPRSSSAHAWVYVWSSPITQTEGMQATDFARKLSGVQKRGHNYVAVCPVCGEPSLTFSDGKNGLLLGCYQRGEPGQPDAARARFTEMTAVEMLGHVDELTDGRFSSVDAATEGGNRSILEIPVRSPSPLRSVRRSLLTSARHGS